ncbi:unnamed protein product [Parnassius mnemosyne]|uniref:Peptidase S1 domain-containing protein n=1 Tax=Parnassius mnemosyne TaxID=213953 RepID=A0AAV1KK30_9NEOP
MHGIQFCLIFTLMFVKLLKCSDNRNRLIVNGEYAKIENFPHSVFLYMDCIKKWRCGSSILNQKILLTAAHCLEFCGSDGKIYAFAGHENINKVNI